MKLSFLITVFFVLVHYSCIDNKDKKVWDQTVVSMVSKWYDKKIYLPDSLPMINASNDTSIFLLSNIKNEYKLVTFINAECSVCLIHFKFWEKFVQKIKNENLQCDFIFFVSKRFVEGKVIRDTDFTQPYVIDDETLFISENELWDKRFQCVLLNENNQVVIIGDPTLNAKLADYYYLKIKNQ